MAEAVKSQTNVYARSEHQKKYDRQMRLWGGHGQRNIEESRICVLGSGPTASESLKNLVLPNIGEFTIVDDAVVSPKDLGNNFFVSQDRLGEPRAKVVMEMMLEMNDTVKGNWKQAKIFDLLKEETLSFFDQFSLVIAAQMYGKPLEALAAYLYKKRIPLVVGRTNGLMGYVRLQVPELCVIESKPDDKRDDLYIYPDQLTNFPELQQFIASYDLMIGQDINADTPEARAKKDVLVNIPAPVITAQRLATWIKEKGGVPKSQSEKNAFKTWMCEGRTDMTNWDQSRDFAPIAYMPPRMPQDLRDVLADPAGKAPTAESDLFWVMVRGLRDFMENEGKGFLPVTTKIPDFEADSKSYITLKNIYKARAEKDKNIVKSYIEKRLQEVGKPADTIDSTVIERFVKNCRMLHVERMRSIAQEFSSPNIDDIHEDFDEFDMSMLDGSSTGPTKPKLVNWYMAFRCVDEFYNKFQRLPGTVDTELDKDLEALKSTQAELFKSINLERDDFDTNCLAELTRFGGSEPHTVGAYVGGVVSQAVLKIVLRQYYPFNHTMIFDGIFCQAKTFKY